MAYKVSALDVLNNYIRDKQAYKKDSVSVGGKEQAAIDIPQEQINILAQELDSMVDWDGSPRIASMIIRGAPRILDAVRMVNSHSLQGYGGAGARGQGLVVQKMIVTDILKYNASSTTLSSDSMSTWKRTITSTGATQWSGTSAYQNTMIVSSLPYLAHVFLGFVDTVEVPCIDRIQLIKEGDAMIPEVLDFNLRSGFGNFKTPTHELLQPWIIGPSQKYYLAANYYLVGDDKLEPVAFTVKRASDIISALA